MLQSLPLLGLSKLVTALPGAVTWIFLTFSIGAAAMMALSETIYFVTHRSQWLAQSRLWLRVMLRCVAFTVAGAAVMGFVLAYNWAGLWQKAPQIFSWQSLACEGGALLIEAFLLLMVSRGRKALSASSYLAFAYLAGLGLVVVAWWPLAINGWMGCPQATGVDAATLDLHISNMAWVVLSPMAFAKGTQVMLTGWACGAAMGLCRCFWVKPDVSTDLSQSDETVSKLKTIDFDVDRLTPSERASTARIAIYDQPFYRHQVLLSAVFGLASLFLALCVGDATGVTVTRQQPMKMAAAQGLQQGRREAPLSIVPGVEIPHMLSRLALHHNRAFMPGISDVLHGGYSLPEGGTALSLSQRQQMAQEALRMRPLLQADKHPSDRLTARWNQLSEQLGYLGISSERDLVPPVSMLYWTLRLLMIAAIAVGLLMVLALYIQLRGGERSLRWMRLCSLALPFTLLTGLCGWLISEVGRGPWTVTGLLPVQWAVSEVSPVAMWIEAIAVVVASVAVLAGGLRIVCRTCRRPS